MELRVPVGGGEVEVLGELTWTKGRTIVADGVVYKAEERLRPGDDEAERWLPYGGDDFTRVVNLTGGLGGWQQAGLPVEK